MKFTFLPVLVLAILTGGTLRGDKPPESLTAWIPDNVVGYVKVEGLEPHLDAFLASGLYKEVERLGLIEKATREEGGRKLLEGFKKFREATGLEPLDVLRRGLGREVVGALRIGFAGPEGVLLTRASSADALEALLGEIRSGIGERLGQMPEGERTSYRDRAIEKFDQVSLVVIDDVLIVSNSARLLEGVLDLATGNADGSVASSTVFAGARETEARGGLATLVLRPQFLPGYEIPSRVDNAVASLLVQGIFGCLETSDILAASLNAEGDVVVLELRSTFAKEGLAARYESFFPAPSATRFVTALRERGVLASVSLKRDLASWWAAREDLLEPQAVGGLLQFEQIMGILFGGKSFGEEVLPQFRDEILLLARNQKHEDLEAPPSPTLPGFAVVFELSGAGEFANSLVGAFQTVVGLMNADRAQKKKDGGIPMLLTTEKVSGRELYTVKSNTPAAGKKAGLVHNFTPSFAVVGERVLISSSKELARLVVEEIVTLPGGEPPADAGEAGGEESRPATSSGDSLTIDGAQLGALLEANEEFLVADVMLKKGRTKEEAEEEIEPLIGLSRHLRDVRLETTKGENAADLRLRIRLAKPGSGPSPQQERSRDAREARL